VGTTRLRWMMLSRTFIALRKIKDRSGQYLLQPDVTADAPLRLLGIRSPSPTASSPTAARHQRGQRHAGRFLQIAVARDLAPSVKILDQTYGDFDQQAIRVVARYDAAPLNPSAVIVLRGVTS
jgi:HK97 family phage major capsid protein